MTMSDFRQTQLRAAQAIEGAFSSPSNSTTTKLSISTSAAAAGGLIDGAVYRLWADLNCFVLFTDGGSTDAAVDDMPLTSELPEWVVLRDVDRISAITVAGTGSLYITRMG